MARLDDSDKSDSRSELSESVVRKGRFPFTDNHGKESNDCEEGIESAIPLMKDRDGDWVVHAKQTRRLTGQFHDIAVMCMTFIGIAACIVCYMMCPKCLFGILLLSVCMCPFIHSMNIVLWLAIILLIVSGWSFSAGALSITWNNGL